MKATDSAGSLLKVASRLSCWLGAAALLAMMLVIVADVAMRNFFNMPIRASIELVEVTLVLVVALGLPQTFLLDEHIVVDLVDEFLSRKATLALRSFAALLTIILLLLFASFMVSPMRDVFSFGDVLLELQLQLGWLWLVIWIAILHSSLVMAFVLFDLVTQLRSMFR